jgi:hypothetical protein
MKQLWLLIALSAAALVAAGCPDDPDEPLATLDKALVTKTANDNVSAHLDSVANLLLAYQASSLVGEVFPREAEPCSATGECPPPPEGADVDMRSQARDLEKKLADRVFNEANVESADSSKVVYHLSSELMCPEEIAEPGAAPERDPDCVKLFTDLAVRLVVTVPAEGDLDIEVQIGDARPGSLQLHAAKVAAVLDLAGIKAAAAAIADTLGKTVAIPSTCSGRIELALTKLSDTEYRGTVSILEAVQIVHQPATDPEHLALQLAPATDAIAFTLDGAQKRALASVAFGAIDAEEALDLFDPRDEETCTVDQTGAETCESVQGDPRTGMLALHLAGLTGEAQLSVDQDQLTLTNLSLGESTSTVKYDGSQILAVDLNAAAGRKLDLTITESDSGPIVKVKPSFELAVAHAMGVLQNEYPDMPAWAIEGLLGIKLDGAAEPAVRFLKNGDVTCTPDGVCDEPAPSGLLEVLAGTLTLSATNQQSVVVQAASCLVESDTETSDDSHPWTELAAGSCQ